MSEPESRRDRIHAILQQRFKPLHLELHDESERHVGHAGATSGGGHYRAVIVSARFEGRSRLDQHRMVHEALGELLGSEIHALGLRTCSPSEWEPD
jgi:BolA protein